MRTSERRIDLIAKQTGFHPEVYPLESIMQLAFLYGDPGRWADEPNSAIGYRHKLVRGEAQRYARGISRKLARDLLKNDIRTAEKAVHKAVQGPWKQHQFDSLVEFAFCIGAENFKVWARRYRSMLGGQQLAEIVDDLVKRNPDMYFK